MNKVILIGRLCADPEFKTTASGTPVAMMRIAVDRQGAQEGAIKADFIDLVAWRQTAEFAQRNMTKGRLIAVTGTLRIEDYTDKEGNKRKSSKITVDTIEPLDKRNDNTSSTGTDITDPFED